MKETTANIEGKTYPVLETSVYYPRLQSSDAHSSGICDMKSVSVYDPKTRLKLRQTVHVKDRRTGKLGLSSTVYFEYNIPLPNDPDLFVFKLPEGEAFYRPYYGQDKPSGYHYPNFPKTAPSKVPPGHIDVLREAASVSAIGKWSTPKGMSGPKTIKTADGDFVLCADNPGAVNFMFAWRFFVFGRCPSSSVDAKPWKLLYVDGFDPGPGFDVNRPWGVKIFTADPQILVIIDDHGKAVFVGNMAAEVKMMRGRRSR